MAPQETPPLHGNGQSCSNKSSHAHHLIFRAANALVKDQLLQTSALIVVQASAGLHGRG